MVVVREHDAQANDVAPGNIGILRAETIGEQVRGFPDNLKETLDRQLAEAIFVPRDLQDLVGRVEDVLHSSLSLRLTGRWTR